MTSVDPVEIARFAAAADKWWDANGPFRPLHKFNPARLVLLRRWIETHFGRGSHAKRPFEGLSLLDVGCGGGLISEPMARLGASVLGIDAAQENIAAASAHAAHAMRAHHPVVTSGPSRDPCGHDETAGEKDGIRISYQVAAAEDLAASGRQFDVVLAMEIIEHVADREVFLAALARLLAPGGLMVIATLNRTAKSFALAILGAEYLLNWVPRGTHEWRKFPSPGELSEALSRQGLEIFAKAGLSYNPIFDRWSESSDLSVNYMIAVRRRKC